MLFARKKGTLSEIFVLLHYQNKLDDNRNQPRRNFRENVYVEIHS